MIFVIDCDYTTFSKKEIAYKSSTLPLEESKATADAIKYNCRHKK